MSDVLQAAADSLEVELRPRMFFLRVMPAYAPPNSSHLVVYVSCSLGAASGWVPHHWQGYPVIMRRSRPPQPEHRKKRIF